MTLYQVYELTPWQTIEKVEGESYLLPEEARSRAEFLGVRSDTGAVYCYSPREVAEGSLFSVFVINRFSGERRLLIDCLDSGHAVQFTQDARRREIQPEDLGMYQGRPCWQGFDVAIVPMPEPEETLADRLGLDADHPEARFAQRIADLRAEEGRPYVLHVSYRDHATTAEFATLEGYRERFNQIRKDRSVLWAQGTGPNGLHEDWEPFCFGPAPECKPIDGIARVGEYVLLYQAGLANLYRRDAQGLVLLQQDAFRTCESIAQGLILAGKVVRVWHANVAGDARLQVDCWERGTGGAFDDQQNPPIGCSL